MIAILWAIIQNAFEVVQDFKKKDLKRAKIDLIELIVASLLFIGYVVYLIIFFVNSDKVTMEIIISHLIAVEAGISATLGSVMAVVHNTVKKTDPESDSKDE
jgi:hypothetical protein